MDDVITLIKKTVTGHDDYGNETTKKSERELFCQVYGITRQEFYSAAVADLHPEITVRLSDYADYEGEDLARYRGTLYSIIRTYRDRDHSGQRSLADMSQNAIELILQRKVGDQ